MAEPGLVAERLLRVIDEGQRTATYKLALILALLDASASHADADGRAPQRLHTRVVAEHVVRLYLPQVRSYLGAGAEDGPLRQISSGTSVTLRAVLALHLAAGGATTLEAARSRAPEELERCLDEVELNFARFPVLRLQVVGGVPLPFLYDADWTEHVSLRRLHAPGGGWIRFRDGASDQLVQLAPLVRPLVEVHWVRQVARWNGLDVETEQLRRHLFGADRVAFPAWLRGSLADVQDGRCFYCGDPLPTAAQVDHVLPWSRFPNDAVENLVLADTRCNASKRDLLVGIDHLSTWVRRNRCDLGATTAAAIERGWPTDPDRSVALMRAGYAHLPEGTPLWIGRNRVAAEDLVAVRTVLAFDRPG
jgi:5-methylcytosine-specific restriction endonuclease McrA